MVDGSRLWAKISGADHDGLGSRAVTIKIAERIDRIAGNHIAVGTVLQTVQHPENLLRHETLEFRASDVLTYGS